MACTQLLIFGFRPQILDSFLTHQSIIKRVEMLNYCVNFSPLGPHKTDMRRVNTKLEPNATLKSNLSAWAWSALWWNLKWTRGLESDWDHLKQSLIWCCACAAAAWNQSFLFTLSECVWSGISNCIFNTCLQALDSQKKCLELLHVSMYCILSCRLSRLCIWITNWT